MLVVTCDLRVTNYLTVDGRDYTMFAASGGRTLVVTSTCPHRGGPLHLGRLDARRARIVCPWHELGTPVRKLVAGALPAVRRGTTMTVVVDAPEHGEVVALHRLTSPAMTACGHAARAERAP